MRKKENGNLTEGPILSVLTKLALPIVASAFLATAYNITDMAWVGMLGAESIAAVGVGGMYVWLSQGLAALTRMGGQVYVAQSLGGGEREKAKGYAEAAIWLAILLGVIFGASCIVFANPLVSFFQLEDANAILSARSYLRIVCGPVVFSYLSLVLTGLYTAQGDSQTPLKANFIGLVMNMILDPLVILGIGPFPRLEVTGAAIATTFSQFVVLVVLVAMIWSKKTMQNLLREIQLFKIPEMSYVIQVVKMGGPTALQSTLYCMFSMVLSRMVSSFGDKAIAVQRVGGQVESISWNVADGFSSALNAFSAQNYGARKMERVKRGYSISASTAFVWGALVALVFLIFPKQISNIFFHEAEVIETSIDYLRIIGLGEAFMCWELIAIGAISGMGNTKICSMISILLTGMRIPLAMVLSRTGLGLNGIWWALTLSSLLKGLVFHLTFKREWKKANRGISD